MAGQIRIVAGTLAGLTAGLALVGCRSTEASSSPSPASPTATAAAPAGPPGEAAVRGVMARTVEVAAPDEHFAPAAGPVTVPDGHGGTLTAAIGRRTPTADGHGQLVFFWQGGRFAGWDADTEAMSITNVTGGAGYFRVTYAHYAASDPACCASRPPVTVTYAWQDGDGFVPSGGPRPAYGSPVRVKLTPENGSPGGRAAAGPGLRVGLRSR